MDVKTTPEIILDTLRLLQKHLGRHCKDFHLQDIKSITGKLGHIATTAPWLHFLIPDLNKEIVTCLNINHNHLHMTNTLLKLQCHQDAPHTHRTFAMAKTVKATHLL